VSLCALSRSSATNLIKHCVVNERCRYLKQMEGAISEVSHIGTVGGTANRSVLPPRPVISNDRVQNNSFQVVGRV
jgi:hypothetical protein